MAYLALGKFSCGRDDVLYSMTLQGWANESDGDSESPTGWFALLINTTDELLEIAEAFGDEIRECEVKMAELRGNFIVTTDSQGFVYVSSFESPAAARHHFDEMVNEFSAWNDEAGDV